MAGRVFELYEDLSPLWQTECFDLYEDFWRIVSIMADRDFALYEDFCPLWQTEGLSYMETFLHYGR